VSSPRLRAAAPVPVPEGSELLERAVGYTRGCLALVGSADLAAPTPCRRWDLAALLHHMDDALAAFTDAAEIGYVDVVPVPSTGVPSEAVLVVDRLKRRACAVLAAWTHHPGPGVVAVGDRRLHSDVLAAAGALEITVHGWDVAQACGSPLPVPGPLAVALLEVVPLLVSADDRPHRFAAPVDVAPHASPGTRLLAALGRRG
jgi:uncharacterized protein (TIGR03086 family)